MLVLSSPQLGFHWLFPVLEMDMQLHRLMTKMGYVGEGYKFFYEVMAIFLLFLHSLPSEELYILSHGW